MIYIGIDPGVYSGGIAKIMSYGSVYEVEAMPLPAVTIKKAGKNRKTYNLKELRLFFAQIEPSICYTVLEEQFSMPHQGGVSMFSIGYGLGLLQGMLVGFEITHDVIHPKEWQKSFGISGKRGNTKEQALEVCKELFPDVNLLASKRSKKPHEGMIDALLICEYGKRRYESKNDRNKTRNGRHR